MPKQRNTRANRAPPAAPAIANPTGPARLAAGAVPSNNFTVNYTAMPTDSLRVLLAQRNLNQTGPRRNLVSRLKESDSLTANAAPPVPDQLSAMIASIVEARLANMPNQTSREPIASQGETDQVPPALPVPLPVTLPTPPGAEILVPAYAAPPVVPNLPPAQTVNGGQDVLQTVQPVINLGNPEDVASILPNYRLPSLASHLSNSQIAAITNGEYVDLASILPFSSLLRDRVNSNLKLQIGNEGLTIPLPSPSQRHKITSIDPWLDAFAIYSSVVLFSYPSRGVDLFSYQQLIRESARKFPGMAWYVYDVEFRRRASHNLSKQWGERDVQLYLDTFTGLPKSILCKSCSSSDHFTDACPLSPRSKDPQGPTHSDICYNFNKGVPCARTPCHYRHQCNKPGCTAAHSGKDHYDLSSPGSQPKPTSRSRHSSHSRT